ncbi:MAG: DUF1254 domain-containing protein [Actinomycetota bacterium]|nr:DUF1254 domain-containing protein [Actinomycetota bacterium]
MALGARITVVVVAFTAVLTVGQLGVAQPSRAAEVADLVTIRDLARDAYVWGLAPEFVYRFSHYQELVSAPVNTLKYGSNEAAWNNNATNAGDSSVLYINAFIDFNPTLGGPDRMVLTVPPTDGQYYVVNYLDAFVNGIGSIGNRTTPTRKTTSYVLVGPDDDWAKRSYVTLDGRDYPVLATDANLSWLLIRIRANSLTDAADPESVANVKTNVVQKFALNSLAAFEANDYSPVYPASYANVSPTPQQVQEAQAWKSTPTNALAFFGQVGEGLAYSPLPVKKTAMNGTAMSDLPSWYIPQSGATDTYFMPAYDQQPTLERFAPIGLTASGFKVPKGWGSAELAALEAGFQAGVAVVQAAVSAGTATPATNYWSYLNDVIGTYPNTKSGYIVRAVVVLAGGSANIPLDAVYPTLNSNDGGAQLDGNNTYSITFTPPQSNYASYPVTGTLPPMVERCGKVAGFWSLVVYQPDATSSSSPFIPQTSVLNTAYSDATSTEVVSVSGNTMTVKAPDWGPIDLSTPLVFGSNAADYGLLPGVVYYVASQPTQLDATKYAFQLSNRWIQELSPGRVPIQQSGSVGGQPGSVVTLTAGTSGLTFGPVQPVSQLGSDQLNAGDLAHNPDGSVTLWLGPSLPSGASVSNWIPTPNTAYYQSVFGASSTVSTAIQVMIRMYYPRPGNRPPSILPLNDAVTTTYVLPPLVKVDTTASSPSGPVATPSSFAPPRNPASGCVVAPGVRLLSDVLAAEVMNRYMVHPLSTKLGAAPLVKVRTGVPVALVAKGLKPSTDYRVRVKVDGTYTDVWTVRSSASGTVALPVVTLKRAGRYTFDVTPTGGGGSRYLRVEVR